MKMAYVYSVMEGIDTWPSIKIFSTKEKAIKYVENFVKSYSANLKYKCIRDSNDLVLIEYTYISPVYGEKCNIHFYIGEIEIDAE